MSEQLKPPPDYFIVKSDGALDVFYKEENARGFAKEQVRAIVIPVYAHPSFAQSHARSDLARKVLALVAGFSRQIRKVDLEQLLNDLFTRERIQLGDKHEQR